MYKCIFLKVFLDESVQEVDSLNSRIQELEAQLNIEDGEYKRYWNVQSVYVDISSFVHLHYFDNSW